MKTTESFIPPGNLLPQTHPLFYLRRFLDLQISSIHATLKVALPQLKGRILEVGCGAQVYRSLLPGSCQYTGIDIKDAQDKFGYSVKDLVQYDGQNFPFFDNSFDGLCHVEVAEHVLDIQEFFNECSRVLKKESKMIFTIPFQARYHYIPFDYRRLTPSGLDHILTRSGFYDISITHRGTDITVALYKPLGMIYRMLKSNSLTSVLALIFLAWAIPPLLLLAHASLKWNIGSEDDCLGFTVIAKKMNTTFDRITK